MPYLDGLPTKVVHLTGASPAGGAPLRGTVRFTPTADAIVFDGLPLTFSGGGTYQLDDQGRLTDGTSLGVELLDNSAPGSNPHGWLWQAIVAIRGRSPRVFYFTLEGPDGEIDLDEIQKLDPSPVNYVAVPGPRGQAGLPGAHYEHVQGSAAGTWQIAHSLGFRPNITIVRSDGRQVWADIVHSSASLAVVSFPTPIAGTATCS